MKRLLICFAIMMALAFQFLSLSNPLTANAAQPPLRRSQAQEQPNVPQTCSLSLSWMSSQAIKRYDTIRPGGNLGQLMIDNAIPMSQMPLILKSNPQITDPNLVYSGEVINLTEASLPLYVILQPGETTAYASAFWFGGDGYGSLIGGENQMVTFHAYTNYGSEAQVVQLWTGPDSGRWYRFQTVGRSTGNCQVANNTIHSAYQGIAYTSCDDPNSANIPITGTEEWFADCMAY